MKKFNNLLLALIVCLILTTPTMAVQHVEDFEYPKPASNTFTNGVFQHNIVPHAGMQPGSEHWDISDAGPPPSGNALDLWPAVDEVTFNLAAGEYVDYAAVDAIDWGGNTTFEVIGTLGTYSVPFTYNGMNHWTTVDTTGQNLGEITMIKLSSYEGAFDNLTINVVPEPTTLLLLSFGGLALMRKRRA